MRKLLAVFALTLMLVEAGCGSGGTPPTAPVNRDTASGPAGTGDAKSKKITSGGGAQDASAAAVN